MKLVLFSLLVSFAMLVCPVSGGAASCDDVEAAAKAAAQARNAQAQTTLDSMIPAPEESRPDIASCLSAVDSLGDAFSMGVKLPSMEQIVEQICQQVDSMIDQKINEGMNKVENTMTGTFGTNNPFQVNLSAADVVNPLTRKLK